MREPGLPRRDVVGDIIHPGGGLPEHINLPIEHQPHVRLHQIIEEWLYTVELAAGRGNR